MSKCNQKKGRGRGREKERQRQRLREIEREIVKQVSSCMTIDDALLLTKRKTREKYIINDKKARPIVLLVQRDFSHSVVLFVSPAHAGQSGTRKCQNYPIHLYDQSEIRGKKRKIYLSMTKKVHEQFRLHHKNAEGHFFCYSVWFSPSVVVSLK